MEILVVTLLVVNVLVVLWLATKKQSPTNETGAQQLLQKDLHYLSDNVQKLQESLRTQIDTKLDKNQASMMQQLTASAKLVADVTERLTKLDDTNKRVVNVAEELRQLQNVLQNPKQRGVLGEFYLEQILQNLLPPTSYSLQHKLTEGFVVDAVIHLDGKVLPIDSKFSLENYNRLIDAKDEERASFEKAFKEDLKRRIDETAKYIQPKKGTLDQALMFIPSEAIYYDLLANKVGAAGVSGRDLMQYAAVEKRVVIVGPSTLSAMLQVIVQGLRSLEIQKDTEVIKKNIEQLQKHLLAYNAYFSKVGNSLSATVGHFNSASKELGKIDKDIVKIGGGDPVLEIEEINRPLAD
ncbi:MAG TPA: DNA recombination protein RmuC [Candidatus Saccharibacteria bacterium]|nr:DNA recombination protein RmuC [Candidatus Saccharibacteria bacterium]